MPSIMENTLGKRVKHLRPQSEGLKSLVDGSKESKEIIFAWLLEFEQFFHEQKPTTFAEFNDFAGEDYKKYIALSNNFLREESKNQDIKNVLIGKVNEDALKKWNLFNKSLLTLRFEEKDSLLRESICSALAESYAFKGDFSKVDALYDEWLASDPLWGTGWLSLASVYDELGALYSNNVDSNAIYKIIPTAKTSGEKLIKILDLLWEMVKEGKEVRRFRDVGHFVAQLYFKVGHEERSREIMEFLKKPITLQKVERNSPCPCGSGKKYKKCCGK